MSTAYIDLCDENFLLYAAKAYDSPNCIVSEFEEDLKRFDYIKRLFFRYKEYGDLRERLILNHLIILMNVFGPKALIRMLFFKMEEKHYSMIKSFLLLFDIMPDKIVGIDGRTIYSSDIPIEQEIVNCLRNKGNNERDL